MHDNLAKQANYVLYGKFPYNIPVRGLMWKFSIYDAILRYYTEKLPYMTLPRRLIWNIDLTIRLSQAFCNGIKRQLYKTTNFKDSSCLNPIKASPQTATPSFPARRYSCGAEIRTCSSKARRRSVCGRTNTTDSAVMWNEGRMFVIRLYFFKEMQTMLRAISRPNRKQVMIGVLKSPAAPHGDESGVSLFW